jgi:predicted amidohydrolase
MPGNQPSSYRALALQARTDSVTKCRDRASARDVMRASLDRLHEQVTASVRFIGPDCKLVVLPEYTLTGHPTGEPASEWRDKAVVEPDGSEIKSLGEIARDAGVYLSANLYESDDAFERLYFQSSLIFDTTGNVILRYRRLNSLMTPTPHDVWDAYLDKYGLDGVFPVARTELGNLACIASEEILFPELARCLAVRGAEVFLHSSSEIGATHPTRKAIAKRARAFENTAWVVSANSGGITGSSIPSASTDGGSQIVDHEGQVLIEAGPGESMVAFAEIDVARSRRARGRPGMDNLLSRNRFELYASTYSSTTVHQANIFADGSAPTREAFLSAQQAAIQRLIK